MTKKVTLKIDPNTYQLVIDYTFLDPKYQVALTTVPAQVRAAISPVMSETITGLNLIIHAYKDIYDLDLTSAVIDLAVQEYHKILITRLKVLNNVR